MGRFLLGYLEVVFTGVLRLGLWMISGLWLPGGSPDATTTVLGDISPRRP